MRVLLLTCDRSGGETFAERLARVGVPLVPFDLSVRAMVRGATPPAEADLRQRTPQLVAGRFDTLAAGAEGGDAPIATRLMPAGVWP